MKAQRFADLVVFTRPGVRELFPWDLREELDAGRDLMLVDIREPYEYAAMRNVTLAVSQYERALELDPSMLDARAALDRIDADGTSGRCARGSAISDACCARALL